jgi:very-short-patch-repair endonuclease
VRADQRPDRARTLRQAQTDAERTLWFHLRDRRFHALKFRRQVPIGIYIVDFACAERHLVIELDGGQHATKAQDDVRRTAFREEQGWRVVRFWNNDVLSNLEGVLMQLASVVCPHPDPLPQAGEGDARTR